MFRLLLSTENRLFVLARKARWHPSVWMVVPLGLIIPLVAQFGGVPAILLNMTQNISDPAQLLSGNPDDLYSALMPQTATQQVMLLVSSFAGIYLLLGLWLRFVEKRSFATLGLEKPTWAMKAGRGLAFGLMLFGVPVLLLWALGQYRMQTVDFRPAVVVGVLWVFVGWLVQGGAEEVLFRGWVLPVVGAQNGATWGLIVSAVMFAFVHALNPNLNPIGVLNLVLFGLFAALYALWEQSLWGVIAVHAVWNWAQGNLFGLPVSGTALAGTSLFTLQSAGGWTILTGGAFGPEGGLAVTLSLLAAIGWLATRSGYLPSPNQVLSPDQ